MLREIIALFGVQVDDKELKAGEASVNKFKDTLTSVAKVAAGAFAFSSIKNLVTEMVGLGAHLDDMSQRYGVGTDALEKWQYAAKMSGVEAESAGSSLGFLQKNLGLAITNGGASAQAFAALGINVAKVKKEGTPLTDVISQVADGLGKYSSDAEKAAALTQVFGRQGASLLPLLKTGSKGVAQLYKEFDKLGGGLGSDFTAQAALADDALDKMQVSANNLKARLVVALLPGITKIVDKISEFGGTITTFLKGPNTAIQSGLILLSGVLSTLAIRFVALNIAMLPELAIAAGIALAFGVLYLAIDEINTLLQGGDSLVGRYLDAYGGAGTAKNLVHDLKEEWAALTGSTDETADATIEWGSMAATALKGIAALVDGLVSGFRALLNVIGGVVTAGAAAGKGAASFLHRLMGDSEAADASAQDQQVYQETSDNLFDNASDIKSKARERVLGRTLVNSQGEEEQVGGLFGTKATDYAKANGIDESIITGMFDRRRKPAGPDAAYANGAAIGPPVDPNAPKRTYAGLPVYSETPYDMRSELPRTINRPPQLEGSRAPTKYALGSSGPMQVNQTINAKIEVKGGQTNEETGEFVLAGVKTGIGEASLRNAAGAVQNFFGETGGR